MEILFENLSDTRDVFLVNLEADIYFPKATQQIKVTKKITNTFSKLINYVETHPLLPLEKETINLTFNLDTPELPNSARIEVRYNTYGFNQSTSDKFLDIFVALEDETIVKNRTLSWKQITKKPHLEIRSIATPVLTEKDNLIDVINTYVKPFIKEKSILCLAESCLAIMQGRYVNYKKIKPSLMAKIITKPMNHVSSLATPHGMQTLINQQGYLRIGSAFVLGGIMKVLGISGIFYTIAGAQAPLIDDISGTMPPYDKCIVLGPNKLEEVKQLVKQKTQLDIFIVDVNDLGKVDVLNKCDAKIEAIIKLALKKNPSGNSDQQTPFTLVSF